MKLQRRTPCIALAWIVVPAVAIVALTGTSHAEPWPDTVFETMLRKSELASEIEAKLLAAAEAEKSAVMADTDDASEAFAKEAQSAAARVEADRAELGKLIDGTTRPEESARFNEFSSCWTQYQELDREILDLAVQNTNLKALRLSFAPASAALDRFEAALDKLVDASVASPQAAKLTRTAGQVLAAALKIHAIEGRHIAEAGDEEMDTIEAEMNRLETLVNQGLASLVASGASIDAAKAAYSDFKQVNDQIVSLSRRNSNVRSFTMSLGKKRKVTAECQDRLRALQEALRGARPKATR